MPDATAPTPTRKPRPGPPGVSGPRRANLSEAEIEVIAGYARGLTVEKVAAELRVPVETVRTRTARAAHRVNIGGARMPGLVDYAHRHGLIPLTRLGFTKELHERLLDVLVCIADGLGDRATATRLGVARATIRSHRRTLYKALGVDEFGSGASGRAVSLAWELNILGIADQHTVPARPTEDEDTSR